MPLRGLPWQWRIQTETKKLHMDEQPYRIESFPTHLQVTIHPGAVLTPHTIVSILQEEFKRPRHQVVSDLWDVRGCLADRTLNSEAMLQIVEFIQKRFTPDLMHRQTAIVVSDTEQFGLTRMFQIMADQLPYQVEIFRDPIDALSWIKRHGES